MQIPLGSKKDIVITESKIVNNPSPFASDTIAKVRADFMESASSLLKTYIAFKNSNEQLQMDNFKADYTKRLQGLNAEFIDKVRSGQIPQDHIATAYQQFANNDLDEYTQAVDASLSPERRTALTQDLKTMVEQNFINSLSKQLLTNEQQMSKVNLDQAVANTNELASMGLAGISQIKAMYDSPDFNTLGELHYQQAWPEQKKNLQSTSFSHFYNKVADELYEQNDEVRLTRLSQLITADKAMSATDKVQLLDKTSKLNDMVIGGKLANFYLAEGASKGYMDTAKVNQQITDSKLTEQQKIYARHVYARDLEQRREQMQADYLQQRNKAWAIVFASGDYLDVDPLLFDSLDTATQNKMRHYQVVSKTDLTINNELLYKIMHGVNLDIIDQGYQDITPQDLEMLSERQQQLNSDPAQQKQASKICQQIDTVLASMKIVEKQQKMNLFGLIMDEIDGQQATQQQPLTAGQINEAIRRVVPSIKAVSKDN